MAQKTFTITRSEWYRGRAHSALYRDTDTGPMRCCLGFYGNQLCDLSNEAMENLTCPEKTLPFLTDGITWGALIAPPNINARNCLHDSDACCLIMNVNDASNYSEAERETTLTTLFAEIGVTIQFVD